MSEDMIESYLIRAGVLRARGILGDLAMACSNVDDSSTGRSTQSEMSGNTRELAHLPSGDEDCIGRSPDARRRGLPR